MKKKHLLAALKPYPDDIDIPFVIDPSSDWARPEFIDLPDEGELFIPIVRPQKDNPQVGVMVLALRPGSMTIKM